MKIEVFNMTALAVILLATTVVVKSESWSWAKGEDTKTDQAETAERRSDEDKDKKTGEEPTPAAAGEGRHLFNYGADEIFSADNETDVENVVDTILFSSRQGRNLEGYDEVYTDPSVQEALQKGDDVQARNLIKQKLCNLGLMSCGPDEVIGKRPFRPPPPPGFYSHGPPKGPYGPPKGPYGPPRPMPPPPPNGKFGPPRKVGYEGFPVSKPYPSKPFGPYGLNEGETFERPPPGATIIYDSKPPPEAVIAGADAPYRFEGAASKIHVAQNHNSFHHSSHAQGSLLHTKPLGPIGPIAPQIDALNPVASATTLQQHVHHHYHHVEGGAGGVGKAPNVIINNPVPVPLSTGNSLTSEFSSLTASSGGFSPVAGVGGIGSNHISPSNTNSGYGLLSQGTYGGLSQSGFNGVNSGANGLYGSGIKPVKEYENADGPFGGYGSGANGGNYASGVNGGNYASGVNGGNYASGINGGNYASGVNGGAYTPGSPGGGFSAGFGGATGGFGASSNFNGNSQSFHSTNPNYYKKELENGGSAFSELNSFGQQNKYSSQFNGQYSQFGNGDSDAYQGFETARQQNIDCVCVPYQQCPAQDRIGRKDDLILPLDPRNLGKNIEALTDEAVITDGNGTMITVRVPKDTSSVANETKSENEPKKVVKREAAAQKQDNLQDPANNVEGRQAFYGGGIPQQCGPQHVCCRRPHRPQQQQQLGRCGTRNAHGITGRIKNPVYVDGDSEFGEYPWQAAILKKDPKESIYVCGGTIIDAQHIITAAHCVKTYAGFDLRVRLGEWDVNHDVEFFPYIERDVISVHIHPEYYAGTLDNDLAVLKLNHPIDFTKSPHISPACLPDKFSDFTGARCWTTGWGKDAFGEFGKYQNILKEVDVPIIHPQQCQEQLRHTRLGFNYNLHPGFICAGGEEGKDACKGDGGGPLVCDRNGIWHVVGVVSWGIGCGQVNVPGVYVRVAHYLDWINSITRNY